MSELFPPTPRKREMYFMITKNHHHLNQVFLIPTNELKYSLTSMLMELRNYLWQS